MKLVCLLIVQSLLVIFALIGLMTLVHQVEEMEANVRREIVIERLMLAVRPGPQPEKKSDASIALAEALRGIPDLSDDECIMRLAAAIIAKGDFTPERIERIEALKEECLAKR